MKLTASTKSVELSQTILDLAETAGLEFILQAASKNIETVTNSLMVTFNLIK